MGITYGPSKRDSIIDRSITEIRSNVPSIGQYAFYGCTNLTTAKFPKVTNVGTYAFYDCTNLTAVEFPNATYAGASSFRNCSKLNMASFPKLTSTDTNMFESCGLQSINLPAMTIISANMFLNSVGLRIAVFPALNGIVYGTAFKGCSALEAVDMFKPSFARTNAFQNCSSLTTLIIRKTEAPASCSAPSNFDGTPFTSGGSGGTIYIPKALYDRLGDGSSSDYLALTNWATINSNGTITWAKIEGSQYENYYADGTPVLVS